MGGSDAHRDSTGRHLAGHRGGRGGAARLLLQCERQLRQAGNHRGHDRCRPVELRWCQPEGQVPAAPTVEIGDATSAPGNAALPERAEGVCIRSSVRLHNPYGADRASGRGRRPPWMPLPAQPGYPIPSPAGLARNHDRLVAEIEQFVAGRGLEVMRFAKRQSKEEVARPYLEAAERDGRQGVVLVGGSWRITWSTSDPTARPGRGLAGPKLLG